MPKRELKHLVVVKIFSSDFFLLFNTTKFVSKKRDSDEYGTSFSKKVKIDISNIIKKFVMPI